MTSTSRTSPLASAERRARRAVSRGAFTLAECLIASVVLAGAVLAVSAALSAAYQQTQGQAQTTQALMLAQELMEEIASRPLRLPDGTGGAAGWSAGVHDRRLYDTVSDYDGYSDDTSAMVTLNGQSVQVDDGAFTRTVSVVAGVRPSGHAAAPAADTALVSVTATPAIGRAATVQRLVTAAVLTR
jgi:Tfp pilus assembly protein PilV